MPLVLLLLVLLVPQTVAGLGAASNGTPCRSGATGAQLAVSFWIAGA